MPAAINSNFHFLREEHPIVYNTGQVAEYNLHFDPVTSLFKLRQFGEKLTEILFDGHKLEDPCENSIHNGLRF